VCPDRNSLPRIGVRGMPFDLHYQALAVVRFAPSFFPLLKFPVVRTMPSKWLPEVGGCLVTHANYKPQVGSDYKMPSLESGLRFRFIALTIVPITGLSPPSDLTLCCDFPL